MSLLKHFMSTTDINIAIYESGNITIEMLYREKYQDKKTVLMTRNKKEAIECLKKRLKNGYDIPLGSIDYIEINL